MLNKIPNAVNPRVWCALVAMGFSLAASAADTWYVDAAKYGQSSDGKSAATAYGTIQEAIDAETTHSGDTIKVLPGVYDQDEHDDGYAKSRVFVSGKKLTIESTEGKEKTFIVGQRSADSSGFGDDAVRCIYISSEDDTAGTQFRGFTVCNGNVPKNDGTCDARQIQGGGVYGGSMGRSFLIDCTISNCYARAGGAMLGAGAIRCLVIGNKCVVNGAIARSSLLYNCICVNNTLNGQPGLQGSFAINCTFVGNGSTGALASESSRLRNCLALCNSQNLAGTASKMSDLRYTICAGNANYGPSTPEAKTAGVVTNASPLQLFAPASGDYRPFAGSLAATYGHGEMIDQSNEFSTYFVPTEEVYKDYHGTAIPASGAIAVGAVQTIAPAPKGGTIVFGSGEFLTFGWPNLADGVYIYGDDYPKQLHFQKNQFAKGQGEIYTYWVDSATWTNWRPPEMDDSIYLLPPPSTDAALTCGVIAASHTYYVKKSGGSDAADGLSWDTAFATIKKATTTVPQDKKHSVVYVAAGDYDAAHEGTQTAQNFTNRVVITYDTRVRLKGAGKDTTFITGSIDPSSTTRKDNGTTEGCGDAACRCLATVAAPDSKHEAGIALVQGFTLRNGRSQQYKNASGGDNDATARSGAAAYFADPQSMLADCCVTNCKTGRAVCLNGSFYRTVFDDCYGWNGGMRSTRAFVMCDFINCEGSGAGPFLYGGDSSIVAVVNCSICCKNQSTQIWSGQSMPTWNCLISMGKGNDNSSEEMRTVHYGNVLWNFKTTKEFDFYTFADPEFVSTRDLRVLADSPAFYAGAALDPATYGNDYCRYMASTDLDGRPLAVTAEGRPIVGSHTRGVTKLTVSSPRVGDVSPAAGTYVLEDDASLTVSYAKDEDHLTRPYFGLATNGVLATEETTLTLKAPSANAAPTVFAVEVLSETNWYVNANAENDDGNGWTPETAKKTLAAIMGCDLLSGDVVHAAAGRYDAGQMPYAESGSESESYLGITSNRVVVAAGVTLVGDEGADKTVIEGANGTSPNSFGRGTGALRCAVVCANSVLRGFTLFNGNTSLGNEKGVRADRDGGGVYSAGGQQGYVYDCIITNCAANRGGGAMRGSFYNCRFYNNASIGSGQGDASREIYMYGCYVGPQRSSNGTQSLFAAENCTFDGSGVNNLTSRTFSNCLFRNPNGGDIVIRSADTSKYTLAFTNCIFDAENVSKWFSLISAVSVTNDCLTVPLANLQLQGGVPVQGHCAAIDAGNAALVDLTKIERRDALGNPRIMNGAIDVGAFEYDWRPDYAAALGKGVAVTAASENVRLVDGKVALSDGDTLVGNWPAAFGYRARYAVTAEAGAGVLTGALVAADKVDERFELTNASQTRRFKAVNADIDFAFAYEGEGAGLLSSFAQVAPGTLLIVR